MDAEPVTTLHTNLPLLAMPRPVLREIACVMPGTDVVAGRMLQRGLRWTIRRLSLPLFVYGLVR
jgi:hypothetical protein